MRVATFNTMFNGSDGQPRLGYITLKFVDRPDDEQNDAFQKLDTELQKHIVSHGITLLEALDMPTESTIPVIIFGNGLNDYTHEDVLVGLKETSLAYKELREGWQSLDQQRNELAIDYYARFFIAEGYAHCPNCNGLDPYCPTDQKMTELHANGYYSWRWQLINLVHASQTALLNVLVFILGFFSNTDECLYGTMLVQHISKLCPECAAKRWRRRIFGQLNKN